MIEEKRIFENNGIKLVYSSTPQWTYWEFMTSRDVQPTPITYEELQDVVSDKDDMNFSFSGVINLIGIDEFWNRYGKPVLVKKWYVKVPHANDTYYHKWPDCDDLGADSIQGISESFPTLNELNIFTEEEITEYGLEDCEKVLVNE